MYTVVRTKLFERSFKKLKRSGMFKSGAEHALRKALELLIAGKVLPPEYKDHQLQGEFKFYRECHIKGDVLLVYQKLNKDLMLVLVDIGSHASLFG